MDNPIRLPGGIPAAHGLPGAGKTHLARTIVARLREQGKAAARRSRAQRRPPGKGWAGGRGRLSL